MSYYGNLVCNRPAMSVALYNPESVRVVRHCRCGGYDYRISYEDVGYSYRAPMPVYYTPPLWIIPLIVGLTFVLRALFG